MKKISILQNYRDEAGNTIEYEGKIDNVNIIFYGKNNTLKVVKQIETSSIQQSSFTFFFDNATCCIESQRGFKANILCGEGTSIYVGSETTSTGKVFIEAGEGNSIVIGKDCMFATNNQIRGSDAHACYNVISKQRINTSRNITIGDHVWLAYDACVLGGSKIGSGSVLGFRSLTKGIISNNVLAAGIPARTIKKNVIWERPHVNRPNTLSMDFRHEYWCPTETPLRQTYKRIQFFIERLCCGLRKFKR